MEGPFSIKGILVQLGGIFPMDEAVIEGKSAYQNSLNTVKRCNSIKFSYITEKLSDVFNIDLLLYL